MDSDSVTVGKSDIRRSTTKVLGGGGGELERLASPTSSHISADSLSPLDTELTAWYKINGGN